MIAYQIRTSVVGDPMRITVRALKGADEAAALAEYERVCVRMAAAPETWLVEMQAVMTNTMVKKTV